MQRLVLATHNRGKVAELAPMLAPLGYELLPLSAFTDEAAVEDGVAFIDNALIKARFAARATGLPAIADDSGLAVDALGGAPGVHSAHYAGRHGDDAANNAKLLAELAEVPDARRTAAFHCVLVFLRHAADPVPLIAHGIWRGRILRAPRGSGGFGYDPLFVGDGDTRSAAELSPEEKAERSHRGRAVRALIAQLRALADG